MEGPRGGRRWFAVESKSFKLLIDVVGGKLRGCIWERCRGLTSWIRFGDERPLVSFLQRN